MEGSVTIHALHDGYIDQRPDDLRLSLVDGYVNREPFTVLMQRDAYLRAIQIDAAVIGASHIINYRTAGCELTEVFACVPAPGTIARKLGDQPGFSAQHHLGLWSYSFSCWRVPWKGSEPVELTNLVAIASRSGNQRSSFGMVQRFPVDGTHAVPKTVIAGWVTPTRDVVVQTAHSYPNVQGLIMSRTTIQR